MSANPQYHILYCLHPHAIIALVPMATAYAPIARALVKPDETLKHPVIISDTCEAL